MTFIELQSAAFQDKNSDALIAACFAPLIAAYKEIESRGGHSRQELFNRLTDDQRALFVFRAYSVHATESPADLYWWSAYFMAQPGRWDAVLGALRYFKAEAMLAVLADTEAELRSRNHPLRLDRFDASLQDLERDAGLRASIEPLYARLLPAASAASNTIANAIRSNPDGFFAPLPSS